MNHRPAGMAIWATVPYVLSPCTSVGPLWMPTSTFGLPVAAGQAGAAAVGPADRTSAATGTAIARRKATLRRRWGARRLITMFSLGLGSGRSVEPTPRVPAVGAYTCFCVRLLARIAVTLIQWTWAVKPGCFVWQTTRTDPPPEPKVCAPRSDIIEL